LNPGSQLLGEKNLKMSRDLRAFFGSRAVIWARVIALRAALRLLPGVSDFQAECFPEKDDASQTVGRNRLVLAAIRAAFVARAYLMSPQQIDKSSYESAIEDFRAQHIAVFNSTTAFYTLDPPLYGGGAMYGMVVGEQKAALLSLRWLINALSARPFSSREASAPNIDLEDAYDFDTISRVGPDRFADLSAWSAIILRSMHLDAQYIDSHLNDQNHIDIVDDLLGTPLFPNERDRLFARSHQRSFFENGTNNKVGGSLAVPESLLRWLLEQHISSHQLSEEPERIRLRTVRIANLPNSFWIYPRPNFANDVDACFERDFGQGK
jgi:hypothetical protein